MVGDALLDSDIDGSVDRVAPDAPAMVLDEHTVAERPGGAGLAALLATGQGYEVVLITALAQDAGGARLAGLLAAAGVTVYGLPAKGATAQKVRLRADGRVLLRLDRGGSGEVPGDPSDEALRELAGAAAILVSDYGRGVARQPALRAALAGTAAPVVWDPHPRGPAAVPGARLITPNESELRGLTGTTGGGRLSAVSRGAEELRRRWRAGAVAVTLGRDGALLSHAAPAPIVVPVPAQTTGDTCGAGDSFAVAAATALAGGSLVSEAVSEAVTRAAEYVAAGGVAGVPGLPASRPSTATEPPPPLEPPPSTTVTVPLGAPTPSGTPSGLASGGTTSGPARGGGSPSRPARGGSPSGPARGGARSDPARSDGNPSSGAVNGGGGAPAGDGAAKTRGLPVVAAVRAAGGTVVASGGCFDLLHAGHVATLQAARRLGDCLVVCLNSDASVRAIKGPDRPVINQADRARLLSALECVDAVVIFDETTPEAVLSWLRPDVWVKGGDYSGGTENEPDLPEADLVARWGGQTVVVPYLDGRSTTRMIAAARSGGGQQRGVEVG